MDSNILYSLSLASFIQYNVFETHHIDCINNRFTKYYFLTLLYHIHLLMMFKLFFFPRYCNLCVLYFCFDKSGSIFLNFIVFWLFFQRTSLCFVLLVFLFNIYIFLLSSICIFTTFSCFLRWKFKSVLDLCLPLRLY